MKIKHSGLFLGIIFLFLMSCNPYAEYGTKIVGKWNGVKWATSSESVDLSTTQFNFMKNGQYTSNFVGNKEKGIYRVEWDRLYTHNEGDDEIVVQIQSITSDTLKIGMNRSGTLETLILAK